MGERLVEYHYDRISAQPRAPAAANEDGAGASGLEEGWAQRPLEMRQSRTCGVVLASGRESADHQLVDAHLFLCSFDGESAVQAFAQT